jgi:hypothetical protein
MAFNVEEAEQMVDTQENEEMDDADANIVGIVESSSKYVPIHETQFRDRVCEVPGNSKNTIAGSLKFSTRIRDLSMD